MDQEEKEEVREEILNGLKRTKEYKREGMSEKERFKADMAELVQAMKDNLEIIVVDDEMTRLQKQAKVLDAIISKLLMSSLEEEKDFDFQRLLVAMRAQTQYRETVKAMDALVRHSIHEHAYLEDSSFTANRRHRDDYKR